jgi:signal transduction histidine kinase
VVKGLARLHGGSLQLASKLGQGTTTTITLPIEQLSEPHALSTVSAA